MPSINALDEKECDFCKKNPDLTIFDYYDLLMQKCTAQGKIRDISAHLMSLKTNHERVLYVYSIVKELKLLPAIKINTKDDNVSSYYRLRGNQHYKHKQNFEAWQCYNLSLLYAIQDSENYALAISNRSALFFQMGNYEECLKDIDYLFSLEYPESLQERLMLRKERCQAKISSMPEGEDPNESIIADILELKGDRNERYVSASSKLKVDYTKEMGRHVIADEDIEVGEVLVQEEPFISLLIKQQFLFACYFCLSRSMNLYPCTSCVYTLYCSDQCRDEAFKQYHSVECLLLPSIISMDFPKMEWLSLRALLKSKSEHKSWDDLLETADDAELHQDTELCGCVEVDGKWVYDSKYYAPIHTLATNVEKRSISEMFRKSFSAVVLTNFLVALNYHKTDDEKMSKLVINYIADTLLHHLMTSPTNMHSTSTNMENDEGNFIDDCNIASGAYAFLSLLNHSCAPNVVRCTKLGGSQTTLIAIRPIKKGMQIYDNYGSHHALEDRATRHKNLSYQYKFDCACEACIDDWPMHVDMPEAKGLPPSVIKMKDEYLSSEIIDKLMAGDKVTAVKMYQPLCDLIKAVDPYAPCRELAECQETLKQCLLIFQGLLPIGFSEVVEWGAFAPCSAGWELAHKKPQMTASAVL